MRTLIISISIVLLLQSCNQHQPTQTAATPMTVTDIANENMKGNITQVETDTYLVDSATGKAGALQTKDFETYDSSGYTTSYIEKNEKDSIKSKNEFTHNANGYVTQQLVTDSAGKKSSVVITFNKDGKYDSAKQFNDSGKLTDYYANIIQNEYGELSSSKHYHPDSTLKSTYAAQYDSIYYIGGIAKDSVGAITYSDTLKLDDKKHYIWEKETTVTKGVSKTTVTTYTYDAWDAQGNWTQQTSYNEKGKPTKIVKRIITYKQ